MLELANFSKAILIGMALAISSPAVAESQTAQPPPAAPNDRSREVVLEGEAPLRPLPFELRLEPGLPQSPRELVERLYEAIPPEHLSRIGAFYGNPGYEEGLRRYGNQRDFFQGLYVREMLEAAFDAWGYTGREAPLADQLRCIGPTFVEQVGVQLGMMVIYFHREGPIRFHSDMTYAYSRAELFSRELFEACAREPGSAVGQ